MFGYINGYDFGEISIRTLRGLIKNGKFWSQKVIPTEA